MRTLEDFLVVAGIFLLAGSLVIIGRLVQGLPRGRLRKCWCGLWVLNAVFAAAYSCFLLDASRRTRGLSGFVVPSVFFLGANFVVLVSFLSLETTKELKRIAWLERENITDPLTGLYNRRYLDRTLVKEFKRAKRYRLPLSLLMLDVDHFKRINDRYGHHNGDEVLVALANLLEAEVRELDIVARYGGEEIVVIATETAGEGATELAERLREAVEKNALVNLGDEHEDGIYATVSIGVASIDETVTKADLLIQRADTALYRAKSRGRNRVVVVNGTKEDEGVPELG